MKECLKLSIFEILPFSFRMWQSPSNIFIISTRASDLTVGTSLFTYGDGKTEPIDGSSTSASSDINTRVQPLTDAIIPAHVASLYTGKLFVLSPVAG